MNECLNCRRLKRHHASRFLILDLNCSVAGVADLRRVISLSGGPVGHAIVRSSNGINR